jgi:N-acetylglucosamine kinase-like BadF-type ATPase
MNKALQFKDQIKNLAAKNHVPAQAILQNIMLERLLERISVSKYKEAFILKGGMLTASMVGISSQTTMDKDIESR